MNIANYAAPQRHTLMFRVSTDIKPGKVIQMVASGNPDDFDQMDMLAAPAFCRVDFINAQVSKELLNEVGDWYESRKAPALIPSHYYWCKKHKQRIAAFIHHSLPLAVLLAITTGFLWYTSEFLAAAPEVHYAATVVICSFYFISSSKSVGHYLARLVYTSLANLEGSKVVFEFTSDDRKKITALDSKNKEAGHSFGNWRLA